MKKIFSLMLSVINLTCSELQPLQPSLHSTLARPVLDRELRSEQRKYCAFAHLATLIPFSSRCCDSRLDNFLQRIDSTYDAESVQRIIRCGYEFPGIIVDDLPPITTCSSVMCMAETLGFNIFATTRPPFEGLTRLNIYGLSLALTSLCCGTMCHNAQEKQRDIRERIQRRYNLPE